MPAAIASWFREHGHPVPEGVGPVTRAIYDSIALNQRHTVDTLASPGAGAIEEMAMFVGGGVQARSWLRRPRTLQARPCSPDRGKRQSPATCFVSSSPQGAIGGLEEGRAIVRRSTDLATYRPRLAPPGRRLTRPLRRSMPFE